MTASSHAFPFSPFLVSFSPLEPIRIIMPFHIFPYKVCSNLVTLFMCGRQLPYHSLPFSLFWNAYSSAAWGLLISLCLLFSFHFFQTLTSLPHPWNKISYYSWSWSYVTFWHSSTSCCYWLLYVTLVVMISDYLIDLGSLHFTLSLAWNLFYFFEKGFCCACYLFLLIPSPSMSFLYY